jgi:hypothetical protein
MIRIGLSRLKKVERAQRRFSSLERMSDHDLMVVVFGYDTPELRAAQALASAGDDDGFERMLRAIAKGCEV